jgi:hypothetical protein
VAYDFAPALKARLALIDDLGTSQTTFAKMQAQKAAAQRQADQQRALLGAQFQGMQRAQGMQGQQGGGSDAFERFKNAIGQQESGGNYNARNPSGAIGKYQIMSANIPGWSNQALGYTISAGQFAGSPELQEKVAEYHLRNLYNKYGAAGAAVAWYAGEGTAKKWIAAGGNGYNGAQGAYPSINKYVQQLLARMG